MLSKGTQEERLDAKEEKVSTLGEKERKEGGGGGAKVGNSR